MKKLIVLLGLVALVMFFAIAGSIAPRRGLIVNKFDGRIIVNTHPQQPMELNPWQQPRMVIQMEWYATNKHEASVVLSFLSMSKRGKLCAGLVTVGGFVVHLGLAEYESRIMKGGLWEIVNISIQIETLNQLAHSKMPLKFKVCGTEFYLHKYEAEDLRQAVELWRRW